MQCSYFCKYFLNREEVLREQFGIRLRTTNNGAAPQVSNTDTSDPTEPQEVSPEFLAALPPDVQQEVGIYAYILMQHLSRKLVNEHLLV